MIQSSCTLCPRLCHSRGFCGASDLPKVARAALHFWEEPCISGERGSGAVFFSNCSLRCVFCQNREISRGRTGKEISVSRLCDIFFELQAQGAHNINLVTPTHYVPQIAEAIRLAKERGFSLPFVYNSSCYEMPETIASLSGLIDIYLPDFKYMDPVLSGKYSFAPDYPEAAKKALAEMVLQCGDARFDSDGIMHRGVIVRHLMLPGQLSDSKAVIRYLYETYGDRIYISIMNQYTPMPGLEGFPELQRSVTEQEYEEVVDYAVSLGVENGFIQEGGTVSESFIPDFDCTGV